MSLRTIQRERKESADATGSAYLIMSWSSSRRHHCVQSSEPQLNFELVAFFLILLIHQHTPPIRYRLHLALPCSTALTWDETATRGMTTTHTVSPL